MKYLFSILLPLVALIISGCASMDDSMAGSGTDIPDEKPLSEQRPMLTNPSPSPGSAQPPGVDQSPAEAQ